MPFEGISFAQDGDGVRLRMSGPTRQMTVNLTVEEAIRIADDLLAVARQVLDGHDIDEFAEALRLLAPTERMH